MAINPLEVQTLAPKPATVSSTISMETTASANNGQSSTAAPQPTYEQQPYDGTAPVEDQASTHPPNVATSQSYPSNITPPTYSPNTPSQPASYPSPLSLVPRPDHVPAPPAAAAQNVHAATTNTVPEFLYQLTKMLTDNNRDTIEWSNGKIEVHNPHKLQTNVLNKYFRHSKFASFQRQLNYFGFRKLAGKGKMAPCSYVNDATTDDLGSLLHIKRKVGEEKNKRTKKRGRGDGSASQAGASDANVNPVLAGILHRSSSSSEVDGSSAALHNRSISGQAQSSPSQQALARVAVGKGIKHRFSLPHTNPVPAAVAHGSNTAASAAISDANQVQEQSVLSALADNYQSSLQDQTRHPPTESNANQLPVMPYVPGSMRRDDSLIDLAMIPLAEETCGEASAPQHETSANGMTFVDFPFEDPASLFLGDET